MSGGTWTLQDKIRPGAYLRFSADAAWNRASAGAGVATIALEMSWGPEQEVMEIYAGDLLSGKYESLLGYPQNHEKLLAVRECLANCNKLLLYRVNTLGYKAQAELGALMVTAKYAGIRGNAISVSVSESSAAFVVTTYVDGEEKERQVVSQGAPNNNPWVDFVLNGDLSPVAATSLNGGSDGNATAAQYGEYFDAMRNKDWQVMALPSLDPELPPLLKEYIYDLRENLGKKVQGVAYDYAPNYEGIITVDQGYVKNGVRVEPYIFTAWVAGISAGAEINQSNTYRVIENAESIINQLDSAEIEAKLNKGYFVISRRTDGTIVAEQDINTLIAPGVGKNSLFRKNRVLRTLDKIANGITNMFETNYIGVISNNAEGRDLFKQDIKVFLSDLAAIGAIENFAGAEDIEVTQGANADSVMVTLAVCPVDAMEKLYITVEVTA